MDTPRIGGPGWQELLDEVCDEIDLYGEDTLEAYAAGELTDEDLDRIRDRREAEPTFHEKGM